MAINAAGLELVKYYEGLRLNAYVDPVGVWTIGWGHTGPDVYPGQTITKKQAEDLLEADLLKHEDYVDSVVKVRLNDNQRSALVSFAFNVGNGALGGSTLLRKLNEGDYHGAAKEFSRWVKGTINGVRVTLPGLVKRRKAESDLFQDEIVDLSMPKMEVSPVDDDSVLPSFSGNAIPLSLLGGHRDLVVAIQRRLADLGYLDPPIDGKFGPVSHWALAEFCYANGLSLGMGFTRDIAQALVRPTKLLPEIVRADSWLSKAVAYMQAKGHWICRHPECFNTFYLEGVDPDGKPNDDAVNVFNDLRIVFKITSDGTPKLVECWDATTEPGIYWTQNPMSPKGAARIAFGQYKSWIVGTHLAGSSSAHEALVQVEPVTVHRDLNRDYKRTNDSLDTGLFGINQHWGYDAPKNDLGRTSAGCLVGRSKDGHREFMQIMKSDPRYRANAAYRFMAAILPGDGVFA